MDLKNIILRERSQRKTITIWFHLYMKSKKRNKHSKTETNSEIQNTGGLESGQNMWRELRGTDFQLWNQCHRNLTYSVGNTVNNKIVWWQLITKQIMVTISKCRWIWNHYAAYLRPIWYCMSVILQLKKLSYRIHKGFYTCGFYLMLKVCQYFKTIFG